MARLSADPATGRVLGIAALLLAQLVLLPMTSAEARRLPPRDRDEETAAVPARKPDGPLQIIISIGSQRLWVYDKHGLLETSIVSTGTGGFPTPTGVFAVIDKEKTHYSNIYGGASMPNMQRLTMSGVALHSGVTTGRPASHGCIRLPHGFSIKLFNLTQLGVRVIVAPNEPKPAEIAHPRLFVMKPPPAPEPLDLGRAKGIAVASANAMTEAIGNARVGKITAWRTGVLRSLPVSVFVSKAEGKVFVRHGFRQILEAPATIRDPGRLLGTHVYQAAERLDDAGTMRWFSVTVPATEQGIARSRKVSRASSSEAEPLVAAGPPSTAAEALDRIELPQEAIDRISEMLTPGASLIVSDYGNNREMRETGTDFIVLTR
ncbi:MAG TPA: L,D-transpeptidase [Hyphomicrobiaceae bacterium]|nr:L,D-transpeptidase [Hyphomicrobiaceae bacterium]